MPGLSLLDGVPCDDLPLIARYYRYYGLQSYWYAAQAEAYERATFTQISEET
jgi:hypothetical protein